MSKGDENGGNPLPPLPSRDTEAGSPGRLRLFASLSFVG